MARLGVNGVGDRLGVTVTRGAVWAILTLFILFSKKILETFPKVVAFLFLLVYNANGNISKNVQIVNFP